MELGIEEMEISLNIRNILSEKITVKLLWIFF